MSFCDLLMGSAKHGLAPSRQCVAVDGRECNEQLPILFSDAGDAETRSSMLRRARGESNRANGPEKKSGLAKEIAFASPELRDDERCEAQARDERSQFGRATVRRVIGYRILCCSEKQC